MVSMNCRLPNSSVNDSVNKGVEHDIHPITVRVNNESPNNVVSGSTSAVPCTATASHTSQIGVGQFINTSNTLMPSEPTGIVHNKCVVPDHMQSQGKIYRFLQNYFCYAVFHNLS